MLADEHGQFLTQRRHPELALVNTALSGTDLEINAPGMSTLRISLDGKVGTHRRVVVWDHACNAFDEGEISANWFADVLGSRCRLVRFDPSHRRVSDRHWTGPDEALNRFSDGFPIVIASTSSLEDLNARLVVPISMNRFRPNIVIDGLPAYDEDHLETVQAGSIVLRIVKPCTRCEITTTDQSTGERGLEPLQTLSTYRSSARMNGGITFGQNAIVTAGAGEHLATGMMIEPGWTF